MWPLGGRHCPIFSGVMRRISPYYYSPNRREGGNKHCFCPSVRPSTVYLFVCQFVAYIAINSRTQRPSVPTFGRKVPQFRCDSHRRSNGQRSRSPGPLMLTHIVRHIFRKAYELQTWSTDEGRRPASSTGAMTSKVEGQGHKVTPSVRIISASS